MRNRTVDEIMLELRDHPDVMAVIVWQEDDAAHADIDPDSVDWTTVEDICIERGWEAMAELGTRTLGGDKDGEFLDKVEQMLHDTWSAGDVTDAFREHFIDTLIDERDWL